MRVFNSVTSTLISLSLLINAVFGSFAITGVSTGGNAVRREVRSLHINYPKQWALYLQALQSFQAQTQSNFLSYFGITGIHGVPCQGWDGSQRSGSGCGYCTHQTVLFGPWHRPYVTLFEMQLVAAAKAIAARYPANVRASYVEAAATLRQPFFDWGVYPPQGAPAFPEIFTQATNSIQTPTGFKTINNPLLQYNFHPNPQIFGGVFNQYRYTVRYPTSGGSSARSQQNLAVATFNQNNANTRANVYNFFSNCNQYLDIANAGLSGTESRCVNTLEAIHNGIHNQVGGTSPNPGHMAIIPFSAFDPVFMLHHANVDRLFAMWQALHPGVGQPAGRINQATYAYNQGQGTTNQTPLKPFFRNTQGQYWTSSSASSISTFRYTYPDFQGGSSPSAIRARINNIYGPRRSASKTKRDDDPLTATNGTLYEYLTEITTTTFQLGGSYNVYVFIGGPTSDDTSTWSYDPNLAGFVGVFSQSGLESDTSTTNGMVSLTDMLTQKLEAGELSSLDQAVVTPYLSTALVWKVVDPSGNSVDPSTVPDFLIQVYATTIDVSGAETDAPIFSPYATLTNVTAGAPGGFEPPSRLM